MTTAKASKEVKVTMGKPPPRPPALLTTKKVDTKTAPKLLTAKSGATKPLLTPTDGTTKTKALVVDVPKITVGINKPILKSINKEDPKPSFIKPVIKTTDKKPKIGKPLSTSSSESSSKSTEKSTSSESSSVSITSVKSANSPDPSRGTSRLYPDLFYKPIKATEMKKGSQSHLLKKGPYGGSDILLADISQQSDMEYDLLLEELGLSKNDFELEIKKGRKRSRRHQLL